MITIISLSEKVERLSEYLLNWEDVPNNVKEFLLSGTDFRADGQELMVYDGCQMIASCSYGSRYNIKDEKQFDISDCWIKGEVNIWR